MKNNNLSEDFFIGIGAVIGFILICILQPILVFWFSYFFGWLTKLFVGKHLVIALNTLFNTNYFKPYMLPYIAGGIGWIGSFFGNSSRKFSNFKKDKK